MAESKPDRAKVAELAGARAVEAVGGIDEVRPDDAFLMNLAFQGDDENDLDGVEDSDPMMQVPPPLPFATVSSRTIPFLLLRSYLPTSC